MYFIPEREETKSDKMDKTSEKKKEKKKKSKIKKEPKHDYLHNEDTLICAEADIYFDKFKNKGQISDAIKSIECYKKIKKHRWDIYQRMAQLYFKLGHLDLSVLFFTSAIKQLELSHNYINFDEPDLYVQRGQIYLILKEWKLAFDDLFIVFNYYKDNQLCIEGNKNYERLLLNLEICKKSF